jgi:formylglycine-generating enzyme required for sulfatase activity
MRFFDLHPRSGLLRAGTERIFPDAFSLREGLAGAVGELLGKAVASRGWKRAVRPPGPGMVEIPPGCFETGLQVSYREPLHAVCLDGFSMDATEATQAAFQRTMGFNPSRFKDCGPDCPVENVSWRDAEQYCFRKGKRLPTEMQWEYAALCGIGATSSTPIQENALDSIAWFAANSGARPHPVGLKRPNPWGLRDMLGNVSEWTRDETPSYLYSQHPSNLQIDPERPSEFEGVARGGNWMSARGEVLAIGKKQVRFDAPPSSGTGFRCVAK